VELCKYRCHSYNSIERVMLWVFGLSFGIHGKAPSTKAGITSMITGEVVGEVVWFALAVFVHAGDTKALGI